MYLTPVSSVISVLCIHLYNWYILINDNPSCILVSIVFTYFHFFVPGSCSWYPITFSHHVSLSAHGCDSFSDCHCFWWPWEFYRVLVRCFCKMSHYWNSPFIFPMKSMGLCILRRKITEVKCPFNHMLSKRYILSTWFITTDANFDHLAELEFVGFFNLSFLPFPCCVLWKEVTVWPTLSQSRVFCPTTLRAENPHELPGILHGKFVLSCSLS